MRSHTAGLALAAAIAGLLTTGPAHAQVAHLVALPGGLYTTTGSAADTYPVTIQAYAIPASVEGHTLSYSYAPQTYSIAPVSYATVSYPQVSYAAPIALYTFGAAPQVAAQLTAFPVGYYATGLVYSRTW